MKKESLYCPCCGKPTTYAESPEWLLGHWKGRYTNVLAALLESRRLRRGLSIEELTDAAYIDADTRPVDAIRAIRAVVGTTEPKLNMLGWSIAGPHKTKNGYWLVPYERQ